MKPKLLDSTMEQGLQRKFEFRVKLQVEQDASPTSSEASAGSSEVGAGTRGQDQALCLRWAPSARATRWECKLFWDQDKQWAFLCLAQNHSLQEWAGSWGTSAEPKGAKGPGRCNRGLKPHQRCPCPFHVPVIFYLETLGHSLPFVFLDWGGLSLNSEGRKVGGTRGLLYRKLTWRGAGGRNPAVGILFYCLLMAQAALH